MEEEIRKFLDETLNEYENLLCIEKKKEKVPSGILERLKKYHLIFKQLEKLTLEDVYENLYDLNQDVLLVHHFPEIAEMAKEILKSIQNLRENGIVQDLQFYLTSDVRKANKLVDNIYLALKELGKRIEYCVLI